MCELHQHRQLGLIDELGKATRFGGLPDSVLTALVIVEAEPDMTTDEKLSAVMRLRVRHISETPGGVLAQVRDVCEAIRSERSQQ